MLAQLGEVISKGCGAHILNPAFPGQFPIGDGLMSIILLSVEP